MKQYKIFKDHLGNNEAVKQGWSWPAFLFIFIWAMVKKQWALGLAVFVFYFGFGFAMALLEDIDASETFENIVFIIDIVGNIAGTVIWIMFGLKGNAWREKNLISRGYEYVDTVTAANPEGALALYLKDAGAER